MFVGRDIGFRTRRLNRLSRWGGLGVVSLGVRSRRFRADAPTLFPLVGVVKKGKGFVEEQPPYVGR